MPESEKMTPSRLHRPEDSNTLHPTKLKIPRGAHPRGGIGLTMKKWFKLMLQSCGFLPLWNRYGWGNRQLREGRENQLLVGENTWMTRTRIEMRGDNHTIIIGPHCRLHDLKILLNGTRLRLEIGAGCQLRGKIKLEDNGSQIIVGGGTTMENGYLGAYEGTQLEIGNDCMFSDQVGIRTGDMHSIVDGASQLRLNPADNIRIGPHVWLCRGVTVLKGCQIGAHSVVGGYSVVTDSLPAGVLAAGIPAKILRSNITWSRERLPPPSPFPSLQRQATSA